MKALKDFIFRKEAEASIGFEYWSRWLYFKIVICRCPYCDRLVWPWQSIDGEASNGKGKWRGVHSFHS